MRYCCLGLTLEQVAREIDCKLNDPYWLNQAGKSARTLAEDLFDRDYLASLLEQVLLAASNSDFDFLASSMPEYSDP